MITKQIKIDKLDRGDTTKTTNVSLSWCHRINNVITEENNIKIRTIRMRTLC